MKKYSIGKNPNSRNGFPKREVEGIKTTLKLTQEARRHLKEIGEGNMSQGVERLIKIWKGK